MLVALLVLICVGFSSGCAEEFDPYWKVNKFRIMAAKASPVTLQPGEQATLKVLAHNPTDEPVDYRWEWCPFGTSAQQRYRCPLAAEELEGVLREHTPDGQEVPQIPADFFELGSGAVQFLDYPGDEASVRRLCEGILQAATEAAKNSELGVQIPVMDCSRGFEVSVRVVATVDGREHIARKRLVLATGSETIENTNPGLRHLLMQVNRPGQARELRGELDWISHTDADSASFYPVSDYSAWKPTPIVPNVEFKFWAEMDLSTLESWRPPAPAGSSEQYLEPRRETLAFQWMGTAGEFSDTETLFVAGQTSLQAAGKVAFSVPYSPQVPDFDEDGLPNEEDNCAPLPNHDQLDSNADGVGDACDIRVWVVVRDGRLGVDWKRAWLRVVERDDRR